MFRFEKFNNQRNNIASVAKEPEMEIMKPKKSKKYEVSSEEDDNIFDYIIETKPNNGKLRKIIRKYIEENHD